MPSSLHRKASAYDPMTPSTVEAETGPTMIGQDHFGEAQWASTSYWLAIGSANALGNEVMRFRD
jgi:hypothetical protein